ncbi:MAG: energy transducer TonB, partial [Alphaproteobacteria bacterium]|nr:energy transducer TonB [Alphaproteobacteria bacterium]
MTRSALYSALLHLAVFLIAWFGLPDLLETRPPLEEHPIIVDLVSVKVAEKTNLPPVSAQKAEEPKPE